MKHGPELSFDDEGRPVLITAAAPAYEEEHRARVRKYFLLMACRIPALILAAVAYSIWENGLLSLAIIVVSIPLPWMAVLIANDRPPRRAEEPRRYAGHPQHVELYRAAGPPVLESDGLESDGLESDTFTSPQSDTADRERDVPG